jgi:hypothetical protein
MWTCEMRRPGPCDKAKKRAGMTSLEETLAGWTGPSSDTEQDKQERTERMVKQAVSDHSGFKGCSLSVYAKGSYPNNTNVRSDSDVDIAVQCHDVEYWEEIQPGLHVRASPYRGIWTPQKLRDELVSALRANFSQVDASGSTAIEIAASSARMDADVIPCFDYRYYMNGWNRTGAKTFRKDGTSLVNYPDQHLASGRAKNTATNGYFKNAVRILKRVENAMLTNGIHREVPSYFIECLVYNCPNSILLRTTWTETVRGILIHIWNGLEGAEPGQESERWLEVNDCKFLFHTDQKWTRQDGRDFSNAAWNYLGYTS